MVNRLKENGVILTFAIGIVGVMLWQIGGLRAEAREIRQSIEWLSDAVADNRTRIALTAFAAKHGLADKLPAHIAEGRPAPVDGG